MRNAPSRHRHRRRPLIIGVLITEVLITEVLGPEELGATDHGVWCMVYGVSCIVYWVQNLPRACTEFEQGKGKRKKGLFDEVDASGLLAYQY